MTELSVDPSTGDLSQIAGGGACVTAGIGCGNAGDTGQSDVAGVADPQQIVLSPDGKNAYVTGAQYTIIPTSLTNGGKNGALVGTTLASSRATPAPESSPRSPALPWASPATTRPAARRMGQGRTSHRSRR